MPPMRPIEEACYWFSTAERLGDNQPLEGRQEVDVAIVGAGFTGLWTALFLKTLQPDLSIAILEQGFSGYGASGRNAGIISGCLDHSHALAIAHFGKPEAKRLADVGLQNIKELGQYASGCDYEASGQLQVALKQEHLEANRQSFLVAGDLGISGYKLLSAGETKEQLNSPLYLGALHIDDAAIINPLKLIQKLEKELKQLGVRFYDKTRVTDITEGSVVAGTESIKADRVIVATDAYSHHLFPKLLRRFIPLYDYILVSRTLTFDERTSIGWQQRQGVVDGRTFFNYYRLTSDNRVLWGTSEAVYYPPNRVDGGCDHSQRHYDSLKESFARHFPQLAGMEFPFAWGGPIASTTRLTPFFGSLHNGRTLYALGYTGHGIGTTRVAGKILAHMALARPHELLQLKMVVSQPFPYPPEPLRGMAVNAVTGSLQRVDAGHKPNLLLRMLDVLGIGFSS